MISHDKSRIEEIAPAFLRWVAIASQKASFSNSSVNEHGVALFSDSCWPPKETSGKPVEALSAAA